MRLRAPTAGQERIGPPGCAAPLDDAAISYDCEVELEVQCQTRAWSELGVDHVRLNPAGTDHWVVRQGLRMFLDRESAITVVGEASDGSEAVELARRLRPDVVLMDILMPHMDGIEAITRIKAEMADVEVIALTSVLQGRSVSAGATDRFALPSND